MGFQTLRTAEALPTFRALVWPHARVLPLVALQVPGLTEALSAVGAQVGLLPCVSSDVNIQLADEHEALLTVRAAVRLLARVKQVMLLEGVEAREALAALRAQV